MRIPVKMTHLALLSDKGLVDVRNDTTAGDGGLDQGVQLLVSPDGELEAKFDCQEVGGDLVFL